MSTEATEKPFRGIIYGTKMHTPYGWILIGRYNHPAKGWVIRRTSMIIKEEGSYFETLNSRYVLETGYLPDC